MCPPCQKTTGTTAFARTPGGNKFDLNFLAHFRSSKENPVLPRLRDAFECRSWKPTTSAKPRRPPGRRPVEGSTGQSEARVEGDEPQLEITVAKKKRIMKAANLLDDEDLHWVLRERAKLDQRNDQNTTNTEQNNVTTEQNAE